jgi:hypothetical protein
MDAFFWNQPPGGQLFRRAFPAVEPEKEARPVTGRLALLNSAR